MAISGSSSTPAAEVDYSDLVLRPYAEMGCIALCNEVLSRLGLRQVAPQTDDEIAKAVGLVRRRVARKDWTYLGNDPEDAKRLGDIVVTDSPNEDGRLQLHTSVIVRTNPPKLLTTTKAGGVIVLRASRMLDVVAVYRAVP